MLIHREITDLSLNTSSLKDEDESDTVDEMSFDDSELNCMRQELGTSNIYRSAELRYCCQSKELICKLLDDNMRVIINLECG